MSSSSTKPPMRDALVAAAFQLFLERGYEQTTVDDIVALAGVGRRSFFRYFPSKEDVVVVVSRRGAPLWRVVQEIEATLDRG